ncbi:polyphosphate polymerase domain-containing protein [Microbulbifer rhizosphaerae]|uniref:VTC domain-containing protein n=1 Tax=Microbulbifer rhizosphaerae TaxID=1562603 RepID=A0A7W4W890_9GAMM|nr:polyphosphate polymerase domain-containing protein [Microbulbifer rhizosphaerae]MBB3059434.1 hypothetical protein [Microbulbifer rhizosphaerae]
MEFKRNELKYYLNNVQVDTAMHQVSKLLKMDKHCLDFAGYHVRSLYFDSYDDECLFQKQSGNFARQKIRLRTYAGTDQKIAKFEIKRKKGQLVHKHSAMLDWEDAKAIYKGDYKRLLRYDNPTLNEIYTTFVTRVYKPKVIVEYKRVAFVMPVSNVRITFDLDLKTDINHLDIFSNTRNLMPVVLEGKQILEVKFDQFLPGHLRQVLSSYQTERMAISKYTLARRYHKVQKWEDN